MTHPLNLILVHSKNDFEEFIYDRAEAAVSNLRGDEDNEIDIINYGVFKHDGTKLPNLWVPGKCNLIIFEKSLSDQYDLNQIAIESNLKYIKSNAEIDECLPGNCSATAVLAIINGSDCDIGECVNGVLGGCWSETSSD